MRISDWSSDVCSSDLFLHRPADTDAQRAGMRSEIAVIMTAALADAAAPAIEPDERAENDVGCCQSGMVCRLLRAPGSFFQRLAQSPATKVHRFDARGMRSEEHTSELQSLMRISYA